jgi:hypothetical protein
MSTAAKGSSGSHTQLFQLLGVGSAEAKSIIKSSYVNCYSGIFDTNAVRTAAQRKSVNFDRKHDKTGRAIMGFSADEDMSTTLSQYAQQVRVSRDILKSASVA